MIAKGTSHERSLTMKRAVARHLLVSGIVLGAVVVGFLTWVFIFPTRFSASTVSDISTGAVPREKIDQSHVEYLAATDNIRLAYRAFVPSKPVAIVVFYHGSGANSGAGYIPIGEALSEHYDIATYLPDIRGHGLSGGRRGDTPTVQQVFTDTTSLIQYIRKQYPTTPLFLGGHSAGAGLVIDYANSPHHESVAGYLFVCPDFGRKSNTVRLGGPNSFISVITKPFVVNAISHGLLMAHTYALRFNYSEEALHSAARLIQYNTVDMALALNPQKPSQEFAAIDRPFGLWIGAKDEVMYPDRIVAFAQRAQKVISTSHVEIVPNETHLSILSTIAAKIGPWVIDHVNE
jgi:alpha-beta hydrolase superfamily lysophospholipase